MAVQLQPFWTTHYHDDNGFPANGWLLYTYEASTGDLLETFSDPEGNTPHTNPIILDSRGEPPGEGVFLTRGVVYTLDLRDENNVPKRTISKISSSGPGTGGAIIGDAPAMCKFTGEDLVGEADLQEDDKNNVYRKGTVIGEVNSRDNFVTSDGTTIGDNCTNNTVNGDNALGDNCNSNSVDGTGNTLQDGSSSNHVNGNGNGLDGQENNVTGNDNDISGNTLKIVGDDNNASNGSVDTEVVGDSNTLDNTSGSVVVGNSIEATDVAGSVITARNSTIEGSSVVALGEDLVLDSETGVHIGGDDEASTIMIHGKVRDGEGDFGVDGQVLVAKDGRLDWDTIVTGTVDSVVPGEGIDVDDSDPRNPVVSLGVDPLLKTGFPIDDTDAVLSKDYLTRTFSVTPNLSEFSFHVMGNKFTKDSTQSIIWPDVEGRHFFYFDQAGELQTTTTFTFDLVNKYAYCATLYWDFDNKVVNSFVNQKHTTEFTGRQIQVDDILIGASYASGLTPTGIIADGSGDNDSSAQFGFEAGQIVDSDIITNIGTKAENVGFGVYYQNGASNTRLIANPGFSVLTDVDVGIGATGRLVYNDLNDAVNPLKVVANNDFVLCHCIAVQQVNEADKIIAIMGSNDYATLNSARTGANTEMSEIITTYSAGIGGDLIPIITTIMQTSNGYSNQVKARIRSTDTGDDFVDWRTSPLAGTGGTSLDYTKFPYIPQSAAPATTEGTTFYDANTHSLIVQSGGVTNLNVGRENWLRVKNTTGSPVANGTPIYINGSALEGTETVATFGLAKADNKDTCTSVAVLTQDLGVDEFGEATTYGLVNEFDTSSYAPGTILYVSATTEGVLTDVEPSFPNFSAKVGRVVNQDVTNGSIFTQPDTDPQFGGGASPALGISTYPVALLGSEYTINLPTSQAMYMSTIVIPEQPITVSALGIYVTQVGVNFSTRLGIYDRGASDTLLAQTAEITAPFVEGFNVYPLESPITLSANMVYMFAIQSSSNATSIAYRSGGLNTNQPNHLGRFDQQNASVPTASMDSPISFTQTGQKLFLSALSAP